MEKQYGKKTVPELQALLRARGIRPFGRKADLVAALEKHDQMRATSAHLSPSSAPSLPLDSISATWPPPGDFRSLTVQLQDQLPDLLFQQIEQYIMKWQGRDQEMLTEVRAVKHGKRMASRVHGLSHCFKDLHFFTGAVDAEMKKRVVYAIKLAVDKQGQISFSSCECAAGVGPRATCKHIIAGKYFLNKPEFA